MREGGDVAGARKYYLKCVQLNGYNQERYHAFVHLGRFSLNDAYKEEATDVARANSHFVLAATHFQKALLIDSLRYEAYAGLCAAYRGLKLFHVAADLGVSALRHIHEVGFNNAALFIDQGAERAVMSEIGIAEYWAPSRSHDALVTFDYIGRHHAQHRWQLDSKNFEVTLPHGEMKSLPATASTISATSTSEGPAATEACSPPQPTEEVQKVQPFPALLENLRVTMLVVDNVVQDAAALRTFGLAQVAAGTEKGFGNKMWRSLFERLLRVRIAGWEDEKTGFFRVVDDMLPAPMSVVHKEIPGLADATTFVAVLHLCPQGIVEEGERAGVILLEPDAAAEGGFRLEQTAACRCNRLAVFEVARDGKDGKDSKDGGKGLHYLPGKPLAAGSHLILTFQFSATRGLEHLVR